ncbi:hypothetical protein D3C84_1233850 [compost metagenome]
MFRRLNPGIGRVSGKQQLHVLPLGANLQDNIIFARLMNFINAASYIHLKLVNNCMKDESV